MLPRWTLISSLLFQSMPAAIARSESSAGELGRVLIKNATVFSSGEIVRIAGLKSKKFVEDQIIAAGIERIKKAYLRLGFIDVQASARLEDSLINRGRRNRVVDLEIDMSEGERYYIRRTEVEGNNLTSHHVVMRAMGGLRPNQPYDPNRIPKWILGLNRLGRFQPVTKEDIEVTINRENYFVDLLVHLKEKAGLRIKRK